MNTMGSRKDLQKVLEDLMGSDHVYFQPPSNLRMQYPCLVYERDAARPQRADNFAYICTSRYKITVVSKKPEHPAIFKLPLLPMCTFRTHYVVDDLNHDVFELYF